MAVPARKHLRRYLLAKLRTVPDLPAEIFANTSNRVPYSRFCKSGTHLVILTYSPSTGYLTPARSHRGSGYHNGSADHSPGPQVTQHLVHLAQRSGSDGQIVGPDLLQECDELP
jgi:hypothetical protein